MDDYYPEQDFPNMKKMVGPRGVIDSWATDKDDPTEMPRWGRVGKQKIDDTGPLTTIAQPGVQGRRVTSGDSALQLTHPR